MRKKDVRRPKQRDYKYLTIPLYWQVIILLSILVVTLWLYLPARSYEFLNWDDDVYVSTAENIKDISTTGLQNIFTSFSNSNYHPLTTFAYALLYHHFGIDNQAYHLLNIFLHLINVLLVFIFLRQLFKEGFIALFGAAIFALHPMHIESVAWISETKDLLYTLLLLLALLAYLAYRNKKRGRWVFYGLAILAYLLSCLSKSAAAIFPLLLLLFDWYSKRDKGIALWLDKLPFFLLAVGTGILAVLSQAADASINMAGEFSHFSRLLFAAYGFWFYILKFLLPVHLSALHYFPLAGEPLPGIYFLAGLAFLGLLIMSFISLKKGSGGERQRVLFFGLGFYLISLLMVLQLIPIGRAIVAERYTYLAYLGLVIVAGNWLQPYFLAKGGSGITTARVWQALTVVVIIILTLISVQRLPVWRDSISLFDDVIRKYPERGYAFMARGNAYLNMKETDKAMQDYGRAISRDPKLGHAYYRRATLNYALGRYEQAIPDIERAVELLPTYAGAWNDRGSLKYLSGLYADALKDFEQTISLRPNFHVAYKNAALALYKLGRLDEARNYLDQVIGMNQTFEEAYYYRGIIYWDQGQSEPACSDWREAADLGFEGAVSKLTSHCQSDIEDP